MPAGHQGLYALTALSPELLRGHADIAMPSNQRFAVFDPAAPRADTANAQAAPARLERFTVSEK
jgi:hypothetical protein